jgi:hypothetical protein
MELQAQQIQPYQQRNMLKPANTALVIADQNTGGKHLLALYYASLAGTVGSKIIDLGTEPCILVVLAIISLGKTLSLISIPVLLAVLLLTLELFNY